MKKQALFSVILIVLGFSLFAQVPYAFKYQAVVRKNGDLLDSLSITVQANILKDGQTVYSETHETMTNEFGLFSINIGMGHDPDGDFSTLNWGDGSYTLKIKVDDNDEFPESPILAVPMALWAKNSGDWTNIGDTLLTTEKKVGIGTSNVLGTFQVVNPHRTTDLVVGGSDPGDTYVRISTTSPDGGAGEIQSVQAVNGAYGTLHLNPNGGSVGIGTTQPTTTLDVNGTTRTKILEITGGDVAEARHPAIGYTIEPGMVVVFDENEPGKIRTTTKPYDKKTAGVVSGKGKYFAGVCLLEGELKKGALPVAQIGTVEVYAIGPVEVGDLLTTSAVPGHAMAATDPYQCLGAVIGKATTSLKLGEKGVVEMQIEKH